MECIIISFSRGSDKLILYIRRRGKETLLFLRIHCLRGLAMTMLNIEILIALSMQGDKKMSDRMLTGPTKETSKTSTASMNSLFDSMIAYTKKLSFAHRQIETRTHQNRFVCERCVRKNALVCLKCKSLLFHF